METTPRPSGPGSSPGLPPRRIIWFAMTASVFIYGAVAYVVVGSTPAGTLAVPGWTFPLVALAMGWSAMLLHRNLPGADAPGSRRASAAVSPVEIVVWSLDEAVAVIGLVASFLTGSTQSFVFYAVGALALLWLHRPRS